MLVLYRPSAGCIFEEVGFVHFPPSEGDVCSSSDGRSSGLERDCSSISSSSIGNVCNSSSSNDGNSSSPSTGQGSSDADDQPPRPLSRQSDPASLETVAARGEVQPGESEAGYYQRGGAPAPADCDAHQQALKQLVDAHPDTWPEGEPPFVTVTDPDDQNFGVRGVVLDYVSSETGAARFLVAFSDQEIADHSAEQLRICPLLDEEWYPPEADVSDDESSSIGASGSGSAPAPEHSGPESGELPFIRAPLSGHGDPFSDPGDLVAADADDLTPGEGDYWIEYLMEHLDGTPPPSLTGTGWLQRAAAPGGQAYRAGNCRLAVHRWQWALYFGWMEADTPQELVAVADLHLLLALGHTLLGQSAEVRSHMEMLNVGEIELVLTPAQRSDVRLLTDSLDAPLDSELRRAAARMLRDRFGPAPD